MKKFKVWMKDVDAVEVVIKADRYQLRPPSSTVEFITGDTSGPTVVAVFFTDDIYGFSDVTAVDTPAPAVVDPDTGRVYEHLQLRRDQAVDEGRRLQSIICDAEDKVRHAMECWWVYLGTHNPSANNHLRAADRAALRDALADALSSTEKV